MGIIVVAHTKGGVGKSTLALNLAIMRAALGKRVGLFDVDVGQSLDKWAKTRAELRPDLPVIPVAYKEGPTAHLEIEHEAAGFDDVIVDAGGEGVGRPEIGLILTRAHVLITPCGTNGADIVRLDNIHGLLVTARKYNKQLRALLVPTKASTNTRSNDVIDFYRDTAKYYEFTLAESVVRQRVAFSKWADTGEAVTETRLRPDLEAIVEMQNLYDEVFK